MPTTYTARHGVSAKIMMWYIIMISRNRSKIILLATAKTYMMLHHTQDFVQCLMNRQSN